MPPAKQLKPIRQCAASTCANGTPVRKTPVATFPFTKLFPEVRRMIYHAAFELHEHPSDYLGLLQTCKEANQSITALRIRTQYFHLPVRTKILSEQLKEINICLSHSGEVEKAKKAHVQRAVPMFVWGRNDGPRWFNVSLQTVANSPAVDIIIDPAWGKTEALQQLLWKILTFMAFTMDQTPMQRSMRLLPPAGQHHTKEWFIVTGVFQQVGVTRTTCAAEANHLNTSLMVKSEPTN